MIGIYGIRNRIDNKLYVGQSININNRFIRHRYQLNKGVHKNIHLQRAWNKYGSDVFEFKLLIECDVENLDIMEEKTANKISNDDLYNITNDFTSRSGEKNPFFGKTHTDESKQKMSEWKKKHYIGKANPNFGGKNREALQKLMRGSKNCNAKLSEKDVKEIKLRLLEGEKHQQIADDFDISRTVVTRINNGARWGHITLED